VEYSYIYFPEKSTHFTKNMPGYYYVMEDLGSKWCSGKERGCFMDRGWLEFKDGLVRKGESVRLCMRDLSTLDVMWL